MFETNKRDSSNGSSWISKTKDVHKKQLDQNVGGSSQCIMYVIFATLFSLGLASLGGHPIFLSPNDIHLGEGESLKDTAMYVRNYASLEQKINICVYTFKPQYKTYIIHEQLSGFHRSFNFNCFSC